MSIENALGIRLLSFTGNEVIILSDNVEITQLGPNGDICPMSQ